MFNFREVFQVGRFTEVESSNIEYTDGTGGIQVILYLEYIGTDYYFVESTINPISSEDVVTNGLLALNHTYYTAGRSRRRMLLSWDPPSKSFYDNIAFSLSKDSVITINGSALVEFVVDGTTIVNATISYDITFIIPLGLEDYQNIALFIYVMFFLYFISIPLMPFILSQIFKPVFGVDFSKDTRERNEKFVEYFSEKAKEKKINDANSNSK